MSVPRPSLEERVAAALDRAGELSGAPLLEFLRENYADDPDLINEITALFHLAEEHNTLLDSSALTDARQALVQLHDALASNPPSGTGGGRAESTPLPATLGNYKVIRVLGQGGMGLVYEAEQPNPRRRVALKVIGLGYASRATMARFRNEAQVLGQLKHPGIAQIYEASTDPVSGEAFFAMEYVDGPPLTQYVRQHNLSDRQRVELLARVCDAVQHAHQKGVIHRDIKPGNILVERGEDGSAQPKVLDFGVAKLTQAGETDSLTLNLDANRIVGTLGYMSPEQFEGRQEAIDTRSDVYALGVVLYELLAGKLPIEVTDLTLTQAATRVRTEPPAKLGVVKSSLGGDLEVITSKALSKEKEDRYASAAELAADLRRYLNHEPIAARAPGTLYTLGKFARRKPGLTLVSAGSVAALIAATVFSWAQYRKAEAARAAEALQAELATQRARAELAARERADKAGQITKAVKDYLVLQLIGSASPEKLGYEVKVVDVIKQAEESLETTFADAPEIQGEIRYELARVYDSLGQWSRSIEQCDKAAKIFEQLEGPKSVRRAAALGQWALSLVNSGKQQEGMALLREVIPLHDEVSPTDVSGTVALRNSLGNVLQSNNQIEEAERVLLDGIALADKSLPPGAIPRINIRSTYLAMLNAANRDAEAAPQLESLLVDQEAANGQNQPLSLTTRNNLVNVLLKLKRYDDALQYASSLPERAERTFPEGHVLRGIAYITTAEALRRNKLAARGAEYAEKAYTTFYNSSGDFGYYFERAAQITYFTHRDAGNDAEAQRWLTKFIACRFLLASEPELPTLTARLRENAALLGKTTSTEDLKQLLGQLNGSVDTFAPVEGGRRSRYLTNLARAYIELGDRDQAKVLLDQSHAAMPHSAREESDRQLLASARKMLDQPASTETKP
ncbi:MAG: protein kinase [Planctomycetes bacterium]|nr:protein kinase [Planctomycetota bacterium]